MRLPFQSYDLDGPASSSRLVNCYIEALPEDARTPAKLVRAPGIKKWRANIFADQAPARSWGMHFGLHDYLYTVETWESAAFPSYLSIYNKEGDAHLVHSSASSQFDPVGDVDIQSNTSSVVAVVEPDVFYHNQVYGPKERFGQPDEWLSGSFLRVTDTDFLARGASQVEFLDNYLLFLEPGTGRFFGADLGSASSFDALNFATAESQPDAINSMIAHDGQLVLLGSQSLEIWDQVGGSGFPFARVPNGRRDIGCRYGKSAVRLGQSDGSERIIWVADDGTVRILSGLSAVRVSTHFIEQKIRKSSGGFGQAYHWDGHFCYVLNLDNGCFVYDATTGLWHERRTTGRPDWEARYHAGAFGKSMVCSDRNGEIWQLDDETYTEFDEPQVMSWTYQPVYADGARAFHDRLEIVLETGVGLTTGQGSDPEIMLEYSDDGGQTFHFLPNRSFGAKGRRETRVVWTGLGSSTQRVYRCSISDPVKVAVTDTILSVRGGRL